MDIHDNKISLKSMDHGINGQSKIIQHIILSDVNCVDWRPMFDWMSQL